MRGREGRRWWRRKLLAPIGIVIVLVAGGIIGLRLRSLLLDTTAEASLARDELLAGARTLKAAGTGLTPAEAAKASNDFEAAERNFSDVQTVLTRSFWLRLAGSAPWLQTQVRAGQNLSDMGIHLARMGRVLVEVSASAQTALPQTGQTSAGEKVLETLHSLDPKFMAISSELDIVLADRHRIPSSGLIPQLSKAVRQLDEKVDLQQVRAGLATIKADEPALEALLGAGGSRTYLVLNQDPAELRGTGGFIGTVGFLSFDHGKMAPFDPVNVGVIDKLTDGGADVLGGPGTASHVDPPYPLEYVFHLPSWELRDANWSPDFPTAAREAEFLLNRERGRRVDGVIALDPFLVERLLSIIGPVKVASTGDVVDMNNFYELTLTRRELGSTSQRNSFLPDASKQIFNAVLSLPPSKWMTLLTELRSACDSRELQAYFHDSSIEMLVDRYGCGGEVRPSGHDSLMIVESNVGGNKDDFWLKRQYALKVAVGADATTHTLRLHYYGLSSHGVNLTGYWGYTGWLRVYLPPNTTIDHITGARLTPTNEFGHLVMQGWFYVQFDHTTDITITYEEPTSLSAKPNTVELYWQKQAGRLADPITVEVVPPQGFRLISTKVGADPGIAGVAYSDLAVDRAFTFRYGKD